jgi:Secretion system C-terminal sorting domain
MKKVFTLFITTLFLYGAASAQSFTMQSPTDTCYPTGLINCNDGVNVTTGTPTLQWKMIATNVPADWQSGIGICDNFQCYPWSTMWPSMAVKTSNPYSAGLGDFHAQVGLDAATTLGCYYVKVRLDNQAITTDTAIVTFVFCKLHPTSAPTVTAVSNEVTLYPNPASNEVNVLFDAGMDVKNIAVYNIIGKMMSVYKVAGSSANLSLDNMPSGIYFVRLVNSQGNIVSTKKFTKQ